jgi:hypothetical protein
MPPFPELHVAQWLGYCATNRKVAGSIAPPMDSNLEKLVECANNDAHESDVVSYNTRHPPD